MPNHEEVLLIEVSFSKMNTFLILVFWSIKFLSYRLILLLRTFALNIKSTIRHPCSLCCTSIYPISFYYHLKNLPLLNQSMSCFSQKIRSVYNNFHFLVGFLRVNWKGMLAVLIFWLSQAFKFFACGILTIVTMMTFNPRFDFFNSETSYLCFLCKKTKSKWTVLLKKTWGSEFSSSEIELWNRVVRDDVTLWVTNWKIFI